MLSSPGTKPITAAPKASASNYLRGIANCTNKNCYRIALRNRKCTPSSSCCSASCSPATQSATGNEGKVIPWSRVKCRTCRCALASCCLPPSKTRKPVPVVSESGHLLDSRSDRDLRTWRKADLKKATIMPHGQNLNLLELHKLESWCSCTPTYSNNQSTLKSTLKFFAVKTFERNNNSLSHLHILKTWLAEFKPACLEIISVTKQAN